MWGFHIGRKNDKGMRLLDLCHRNGMIVNSWYKKRESHVVTRCSWDGQIQSVINYYVMDEEWRRKLRNVRVITNDRAEGDHRL